MRICARGTQKPRERKSIKKYTLMSKSHRGVSAQYISRYIFRYIFDLYTIYVKQRGLSVIWYYVEKQ